MLKPSPQPPPSSQTPGHIEIPLSRNHKVFISGGLGVQEDLESCGHWAQGAELPEIVFGVCEALSC